MDVPPDDWSPADHPYAIAVSEVQWWRWTVELTVDRIHQGQDPQRQIDARLQVIALRQMLSAERLEQTVLTELGMDPAVGAALTEARNHFEERLFGVKRARDALIHFEDWTRGEGLGS